MKPKKSLADMTTGMFLNPAANPFTVLLGLDQKTNKASGTLDEKVMGEKLPSTKPLLHGTGHKDHSPRSSNSVLPAPPVKEESGGSVPAQQTQQGAVVGRTGADVSKQSVSGGAMEITGVGTCE
jgi:hypothetical protein